MINLGKLKRIVSGAKYAVYHRRTLVNKQVIDRMFLRSVCSPHDAMELDPDSLDDAIRVLKAAKKARRE